MNSDNQIVPMVEDDQGEGWKDPLDHHDISEMTRADKKRRKWTYDQISARHSMRPKR
jgi:hypothetical protein